jgi:hypothetical protein
VVAIANGLVLLLLVYSGIGLVFALIFVFIGVNRIDPVALGSSWGFRLIIIPGVVAFWPALLRRWIADDPLPRERNAHRDAAARGHD